MANWLLIVLIVFSYFFIGGAIATAAVIFTDYADDQLFVLLILAWAVMIPAKIASWIVGKLYELAQKIKGRRWSDEMRILPQSSVRREKGGV